MFAWHYAFSRFSRKYELKNQIYAFDHIKYSFAGRLSKMTLGYKYLSKSLRINKIMYLFKGAVCYSQLHEHCIETQIIDNSC